METVGVYLKKERESRNISLHEVSRLTKISALYLDYIEKDEFERLPQGPYIMGYITSYSRLIGGNVDEAIKLYESQNRKRTQTEEIQPEISKNNGRNSLPEGPKANERKKSNTSLAGANRSSSNTIASYLKAKIASLKAACPSIKNIGPSIQKKNISFKAIVPIVKKTALTVTTNRWLTHRRSWLYPCVTLFGAGILILAGFGFYHLFIYDQNPLPVAELQKLHDKETLPLSAIGTENSVLPSKSTDASLTTDQREGHANKKELSKSTNQPKDQKQSSSLTTNPDAAAPRITLKPEKATGTSKPAIQASTPLSGSSSTAENAASSQTTAGKETRMLSGQRQMTTGPSPESTTTDAYLSVLQASICSEIKNRMPAGVNTSFPISAQQIYVWNEIEAQQIPSKIRHIYYFNGKKISDVTLDIRSSYWRTWSSKSISNNRYRGEWRVDIATAEGKLLRRLYFEVR